MKTKIYNLEGKESASLELDDSIFDVKIKPEIVHKVFTQMEANIREPWAHTKDKSDVRGGGRKPWKQKGTGRARHGSIRSPLWKGGGVTFGPLNTRNYKTKINKKVKRLALKMCLTSKAQSEDLMVLENFDFKEAKTKVFEKLLKALPKKRSYLVASADKDENLLLMTNNLQKINTVRAQDLNVVDLLKFEALVLSKDAVEKIEKVFK